jgi:hypothetical protein
MAQADSNNSTSSSRRRFLAVAAAASAVSASALAAAAMPAHQACAVSDDSELVKLEELIFEQREKAAVYDDEIIRLSAIWTAESHRLYEEALAAEVRSGIYRTPQERWKLVTDIPECIEHNRLCNLQEPFLTKMGALIEQMFATPAHTAEGRRAKVIVLLRCVLGDEWCHVDEKTEYQEFMARSLLIEFIGGGPGEAMRDQFA